MAINEMIYKLRTNAKLSQEQFADIFKVSRQSVQKWENGTMMPELSKIIEISGISGLIMLLFSIVCLFVGFVLFPGYLAMTLWNKASSGILGFPVLNIFQGVLL